MPDFSWMCCGSNGNEARTPHGLEYWRRKEERRADALRARMSFSGLEAVELWRRIFQLQRGVPY